MNLHPQAQLDHDSAHSQGPHQQTAFTGATPGVPPPPGRGLPSDQKAGAPVWVSRGQDSHLTKAKILRAQPQKSAQQEPRRPLAPASCPGWAGGPRFQRAGCPPSQLNAADGPRPRSRQAARVSARSRSPPCRPPISPSLAEAPPAPNGKAPLPARAERCAATAGTGSAASPLSTAPERGAAGAGGGWGWARPGPRPPSLALARPGNRAAAGAGPSMRTATSLAVKVSPGPSCRTQRRRRRWGGGDIAERLLTLSRREDGHRGWAGAPGGSHPPAFHGESPQRAHGWGWGRGGRTGRRGRMERRRLGEEGSRSGREDGEGGTKEARLEGETASRRPRPRIPSDEGLLSAMKLPPQTVCV